MADCHRCPRGGAGLNNNQIKGVCIFMDIYLWYFNIPKLLGGVELLSKDNNNSAYINRMVIMYVFTYIYLS